MCDKRKFMFMENKSLACDHLWTGINLTFLIQGRRFHKEKFGKKTNCTNTAVQDALKIQYEPIIYSLRIQVLWNSNFCTPSYISVYQKHLKIIWTISNNEDCKVISMFYRNAIWRGKVSSKEVRQDRGRHKTLLFPPFLNVAGENCHSFVIVNAISLQ